MKFDIEVFVLFLNFEIAYDKKNNPKESQRIAIQCIKRFPKLLTQPFIRFNQCE